MSSKTIDWIIISDILLLMGIMFNGESNQISFYDNIVKNSIILLIKSQGTKEFDWFIASESLIKIIFLT
jgi:hypothetical protein